jgi:hypothetical protein
MTNEQREKIYQLVMASGLQDVLFYKAEDTEGRQVVMDRFENFEAFVWQVEQQEREACAKVCDAFQARDVGMQPAECAGAIRARGQA